VVFIQLPSSYSWTSEGAFVAGLIVPREGGLAITITEKLEDMVSIIFLPLVNTPLPIRDHILTIEPAYSSISHFPVSQLISHCSTMVFFSPSTPRRLQ